ncbi:MAG: OmpA family protein [Pseudorhodobacter sp.]|nr:OmpA family protein [Pseudorhodobacter sp.]
MRRALVLGLLAFAPSAQAMTLDFPGPATTTASRSDPLTSSRVAIGPWTEAGLPTRLSEGALEQTAWRITAPETDPQSLTTLAIMQPLRAQLARDGYNVIFECETAACGGFDFRYGTDLLPEPDMHVDLGDFRYLCAERNSAAGPEMLSLMVSRSATSGFVQLTRIGQAPAPMPQISASTKTPQSEPRATLAEAADIGSRLETGGTVMLDDLVFSSGAADLAAGEYASLTNLAAYLQSNPDRSVALVGHTDATGSLNANIALSRQRAMSVRQRLVKDLGIPVGQVTADGVGYLAPRASNLTEEGRTENRRVEVMLTSTR